MTLQLDIFESNAARDKGIKKAVDHADDVNENWAEGAYQFLLKFLSIHIGSFMAEEVRSYAALMDFPLPPSARAWGGVIAKAAREGLIEGRGYAPVRNVKAHRTPARVWVQVKKAA
jgi:hypothetical protein